MAKVAKKKLVIDEGYDIIEETEFYVVTKKADADWFRIYHKYNDSLHTAVEYYISGQAIIVRERAKSDLVYRNEDNLQPYGRGKSTAAIFGIDACEKRLYKGEEVLVISYHDKNNSKYVRGVDANGDLFKREKGYKFEKIVEQSAGI